MGSGKASVTELLPEPRKKASPALLLCPRVRLGGRTVRCGLNGSAKMPRPGSHHGVLAELCGSCLRWSDMTLTKGEQRAALEEEVKGGAAKHSAAQRRTVRPCGKWWPYPARSLPREKQVEEGYADGGEHVGASWRAGLAGVDRPMGYAAQSTVSAYQSCGHLVLSGSEACLEVRPCPMRRPAL